MSTNTSDELGRERVTRLEILRARDDRPRGIADEREVERQPRLQRDEELAQSVGVPCDRQVAGLRER